jgi:hypothetical protein
MTNKLKKRVRAQMEKTGMSYQAALREVVKAKPEPVAMARTPDGSQGVAFAPAGLEVRAFTADDLDERGMPRWVR